MAAKERKSTKDKSIAVNPIKDPSDIQRIKRDLTDHPRNLALFTVGINVGLRASDLLSITVGQVRTLQPGDTFRVKEKKTGKLREIRLTKTTHAVISALLPTLKGQSDDAPLFQSRKGQGQLTVVQLNHLVKTWCVEANIDSCARLPKNQMVHFGSHTLRKTWAYSLYTHHGAELPALMKALNHSSQSVTLAYIGVGEKEVMDLYAVEI